LLVTAWQLTQILLVGGPGRRARRSCGQLTEHLQKHIPAQQPSRSQFLRPLAPTYVVNVLAFFNDLVNINDSILCISYSVQHGTPHCSLFSCGRIYDTSNVLGRFLVPRRHRLQDCSWGRNRIWSTEDRMRAFCCSRCQCPIAAIFA
jgi:hypothetical protein